MQKSPVTTTFVHDFWAGFAVIIRNKKLFRITLMSAISYLGIGMLWVICPLVGQVLFGNAGYGGLLAAVVSVSALIATAAYAKWPTRYSPDTVAFATTLILSIAMLLLAFAGNVTLVLIAMLVVGLADGPQLAAIFAVRHREAPKRSRSQVFTTAASLKITAAAIGAALAGRLSGMSLKTTILTACLVQLIAAVTFILWRNNKR
jgi:MFS family permease